MGHLVVAKLYDLPVKEFSVGFGKLIAQFHAIGIDWSFRMIPLGGYVNADLKSTVPYSTQMAVLFAGSTVNIVMGLFMLKKYKDLAKSIIKVGLFNLTPVLMITDGAKIIGKTMVECGVNSDIATSFLAISSIVSFIAWIIFG
jgi:membrane-associated protease RseP (regulator of RpoE activity)